MDVITAVNLLIEAIRDHDLFEARDLMEQIDGWINKGGFIPALYAEAVTEYNETFDPDFA